MVGFTPMNRLLYGTADFNKGDYLGGPNLITYELKIETSLQLVAEGEVRDMKHKKDLRCHWWVKD